MLKMQNNQKKFNYKWLIAGFAVFAIGVGLYGGLLFMSPAIPKLAQDITPTVMAQPSANSNRLVIPKINVAVNFNEGDKSTLDQGAWWQNSKTGNPSDGGSMKLVAYHFNLQTTPGETVAKSPFYNLSKLSAGDKIVIDYKGTRYGYEVTAGAPTDTKDTLTLSAYDSPNTTVTAKLIGPVTIKS